MPNTLDTGRATLACIFQLALQVDSAKPSGVDWKKASWSAKDVESHRTSRMEDAHTKSVEEILSFFSSDDEAGLSDEQVQRSQDKYGPNGNLSPR